MEAVPLTLCRAADIGCSTLVDGVVHCSSPLSSGLEFSVSICDSLRLPSAGSLARDPSFLRDADLLLVGGGLIVCSLLLLVGAAVGDNDVSELIGSLVLAEGTLVVDDDLSLLLVALEARRALEVEADCCIVGAPSGFVGLVVEVRD